MSNLSKELSGVILPHDHFGTHLDNENDTIDEELELQNFEHAGEVKDHPVVAEFVGRELLDITITKNGKPIMSVSRNTFYKLSSALAQLVALHSNRHTQRKWTSCHLPYLSSFL